MEIQALLGLTLAFLFFSGAHSVLFTLTNKCSYIVWPGTLTGSGGAQLTSTGFELDTGALTTLNAPATWSGRMFARTQSSTDSTGKFSCLTADCASGQVTCNGEGGIPPASLVEFTLSGSGGNDFYDVSHVDGFNLPLSITPQGAASCQSTSCTRNVNSVCLPELAVKGPDGSVIACKSACLALNQPQYCCTGAFSTPATCPPTNYSMIFKNQCPQAYSYPMMIKLAHLRALLELIILSDSVLKAPFGWEGGRLGE